MKTPKKFSSYQSYLDQKTEIENRITEIENHIGSVKSEIKDDLQSVFNVGSVLKNMIGNKALLKPVINSTLAMSSGSPLVKTIIPIAGATVTTLLKEPENQRKLIGVGKRIFSFLAQKTELSLKDEQVLLLAEIEDAKDQYTETVTDEPIIIMEPYYGKQIKNEMVDKMLDTNY